MLRQISLEVRQQLFRARVDARFKKIMSSLTSKLGAEWKWRSALLQYLPSYAYTHPHTQINIIYVWFVYTHWYTNGLHLLAFTYFPHPDLPKPPMASHWPQGSPGFAALSWPTWPANRPVPLCRWPRSSSSQWPWCGGVGWGMFTHGHYVFLYYHKLFVESYGPLIFF